MKLFLDRNKTLLPRVDVIFLLVRVMALLLICGLGLLGDEQVWRAWQFYALIASYTALVAVIGAGIRGRMDMKLSYLVSVVYDLAVLPVLIYHTGGLESTFYLFFYVTIAIAAYMLTIPYALTTIVLMCLLYSYVTKDQLHLAEWFGFAMRVGFMWIFFLALTYASDYMRKSEHRLLKLFDKLNMRTSELEKSQAQLEMIYENSRVLAGILEPDGVVREIVRIMGNTLQYTCYAIVLQDKSRGYYYRARYLHGQANFHLKALQVSSDDLIDKISRTSEAVRVNNTTSRNDYKPLNPEARSVMFVPMMAHGQSQGLLIAESTEEGFFTERDEQLLSVVARSAGLALENAALHKRTEELSIIDELTECYNYRYFIRKLQEEKKRAVRYDLPLSIIMVDIDWFKKLNDSYGHEVGNLVLKALAGIIKRCVRDVDIFARYGGEEFVVILPQTPQQEAYRIGERIREQVETHVVDAGSSGKLRITVSVGVSSYPENGRSEEELVSVADQALYEAKDQGKNLVCVS